MAVGQSGVSIDVKFKQTMQLHQQGKLEQTADIYRWILETSSSHPNINQLFGIIHLALRKPKSTVQHIQKALALFDAKAVYWKNYAAALKDLLRSEDALAAYENALFYFLNLHRINGNRKEAIRLCRNALAPNSQNIAAWEQLKLKEFQHETSCLISWKLKLESHSGPGLYGYCTYQAQTVAGDMLNSSNHCFHKPS